MKEFVRETPFLQSYSQPCWEYAFVDWNELGINVDGKFLNNLKFADDIVLITDSFDQAQAMLQGLFTASKEIFDKLFF